MSRVKKEVAAKERPEREVPSNRLIVPHVEVEARGIEGEDLTFTKPQFERRHEHPELETEKGVAPRELQNDKVAERHAVQEDGLVTAKRRAASVAANRKASEAGIAARRQAHHPAK